MQQKERLQAVDIELTGRQDVPVSIRLGEGLQPPDIEADLRWVFEPHLWRDEIVRTHVSGMLGRFFVQASLSRPDIVVGINAYRDFVQRDIKGQLRVTACLLPPHGLHTLKQPGRAGRCQLVQGKGVVYKQLEGSAATYPGRLEALAQGVATLNGAGVDVARWLVTGYYGLSDVADANPIAGMETIWQGALRQETAMDAARFAMMLAPTICWPELHE